MNVVYTHKGSSQFHLTTRGKAVHASAPETGENAIYKMLPILRLLQEEFAPGLQAWSHPMLGASTLSVGTIEGGSKTNIVPDCCHVTVDMRTVPGQATPAFLKELEANCAEFARTWKSSSSSQRPCTPIRSTRSSDCWKPEGRSVRERPGFATPPFLRSGARRRSPWGQGSIAQAHTRDEWIAQDALEDGAWRFTDFLRRLR